MRTERRMAMSVILLAVLCGPALSLAQSGCGKPHFTCADFTQCLPETWQCDGRVDCRDGSDEVNCTTPAYAPQCDSNSYKCGSGSQQCVAKSQWCKNVEPLCSNRADSNFCFGNSLVCGPLPDHFKCKTKLLCLPLDKLCDDTRDCGTDGDVSDEDPAVCSYVRSLVRTTPPPTPTARVVTKPTTPVVTKPTTPVVTKPTTQPCPSTYDIQCKNDSRCIASQLVCDGHLDCADGTDEPSTCGGQAAAVKQTNSQDNLLIGLGAGLGAAVIACVVVVLLVVIRRRSLARKSIGPDPAFIGHDGCRASIRNNTMARDSPPPVESYAGRREPTSTAI